MFPCNYVMLSKGTVSYQNETYAWSLYYTKTHLIYASSSATFKDKISQLNPISLFTLSLKSYG